MKVAIVTDSNSSFTEEEIKELGLFTVPSPFLIDEEEYLENVNLTQPEFYEKLMAGADVSTSQPNIQSVVEIWENVLKTHDEIVHICLSSGLSESCATATHFAEQFGGRVQVVNNNRVSITEKQSVYDALAMIKEGKSAKEIKEWLEKTGPDTSIYIMVTTLKYLKKGGRVSPAAAALGSMLKIKPILSIQNGGKLDKFAQVISYQQGKKRMIDQICKEIETRFADIVKEGKLKVYIAYTYVADKAQEFKQEANEALKKYGLEVTWVDPLSLQVACHIGDGSIAIGCARYY